MDLAYSISVQQLSSISRSEGHSGFIKTEDPEDSTTTFSTLAFKQAFNTFCVPNIAGSSSSTYELLVSSLLKPERLVQTHTL